MNEELAEDGRELPVLCDDRGVPVRQVRGPIAGLDG